MGDWAVILVAVLVNERVRARVSLPGRAEFYIDTQRGGWRTEAPPQHPRHPPFGLSASTELGEVLRTKPRPSPGAAPRFFLEMKMRHGPNWVSPLDGKAQVYVGRRANNDLRLTDPTADTRQAVIYPSTGSGRRWEDGRYKINNLSVRVPTRVNNRPTTKQNLGDGNTIQMGRTKLIFRDRQKRR